MRRYMNYWVMLWICYFCPRYQNFTALQRCVLLPGRDTIKDISYSHTLNMYVFFSRCQTPQIAAHNLGALLFHLASLVLLLCTVHTRQRFCKSKHLALGWLLKICLWDDERPVLIRFPRVSLLLLIVLLWFVRGLNGCCCRCRRCRRRRLHQHLFSLVC